VPAFAGLVGLSRWHGSCLSGTLFSWRGILDWLVRAGIRGFAFGVGFALVIVGLALGVSMVLLPVGIVVGLFGVVVIVWALFGDVPGSARA
jgi:hypothetical protein